MQCGEIPGIGSAAECEVDSESALERYPHLFARNVRVSVDIRLVIISSTIPFNDAKNFLQFALFLLV